MALVALIFLSFKSFKRETLKSKTRRWNQSILKEINPEYSLDRLMLKLKFQNFGRLMREQTHWKRPWRWERLKAGGEGGDREWDGWMASPSQRTWVWANSRRWWRMGKPGMLHFMGSQSQTRDWTATLLLREKLTENLAFFWIKSTASTYIPRISLRLVSGSCLQKGWLSLF